MNNFSFCPFTSSHVCEKIKCAMWVPGHDRWLPDANKASGYRKLIIPPACSFASKDKGADVRANLDYQEIDYE